ncbi:MAG: amidohydrolase family protein [Acidimicrobiales bacterium]
MYELIVSGGELVDGTGAPPRRADVAVSGGRIVAVGSTIEGDGAEIVDAEGCIVTPGFVDVHTHYDGQITWDEVLEPSTPHGVTTVVTGNCGVGFAPVRPEQQDWLIELMEGVEDIPGAALSEGIAWGWESFPQYLEALADRHWSVDVGVQLPHGPLRTYVMGERGATNQKAGPNDIAEMSRLTAEAVAAGALGFTTSRTLGHTSRRGVPVPGTFARDDELFAIARAVCDAGGRVFEVAGAGIVADDDPDLVATELDWIGRMAAETGLTATFIVLQHHADPDRWRFEMDRMRQWRARNAAVVPLVAGRPFGVLLGWDVRHPFRCRATYDAVDHLPLPERLAELRRPEVRARILAEGIHTDDVLAADAQRRLADLVPGCFVLGDPPDYEPTADRRLASIAARYGATVEELAYDALMAGDGDGMLLYPAFNYADANHDVLLEQLDDPDAVLGLDDGGAHCGAICDASIPTYMLTHWVRDRTRGRRLDLSETVRRLAAQPADLYGFTDRGRVVEGLRADLNVIDLEALRLHAPRVAHDLPAGGVRLLQDATGYRATIVNGAVTRRDGLDTGARPGRLLR